MSIGKILNSIINMVTSSSKLPSRVATNKIKIINENPQMLTKASECLESIGKAQIHIIPKDLTPSVETLLKMTDKYSRSDAQIAQDTQQVIGYLRRISSNLGDIVISVKNEEIEDVLAKKSVVDYLAEHITHNKDFMSGTVGFRFGLPTKEISRNLSGFQEEFNKSVAAFKKEGILDVSQYDPKKYQFDAEEIMKKYEQKIHDEKACKYREIFDPITRLSGTGYYANCDPYLSNNADFYRIISPGEFRNLALTKNTGKYIDSNGYFTDGHYSCITTNPNYNEQAFAMNGLPIRLKFKTKDKDGYYNMDLLDRIHGIKPERSIYKVSGYNYNDIDWNNVCVNDGNGWAKLDREFVDELISKATND